MISWKNIDYPTTLFLLLNPIIAVIGTIFAIKIEGFSWGMFAFALVFAGLTNLSITAGYHRYFSHRSYDGSVLLDWIYVILGSSAWQGSILKWCTDHRVHHKDVDQDTDPYCIKKGFWYAHMSWMFKKLPEDFRISCPDLQKSKLICFQHRHYVTVAVVCGYLFPLIVGSLFGHPMWGLFIAGSLRIAMTQQSTFLVNSLCHTLGKQPYSDKISARDSLIVAFLTHGEGYHNFHHQFQFDYRNGIRWWQWDPTKWTINFLHLVKLVHKRRTVPAKEILRARLQMESQRLRERGFSPDLLETLREKVLAAQIQMRSLKESYVVMKSNLQEESWERLQTLKTELRLARLEFQFALKQWKILCRGKVLCTIPTSTFQR